MFPDIDFTIIFDIFGDRRPPPVPQDQDRTREASLSQLGALPLPVPSPGPSGTDPFPGGSRRPPVFDFPRLPGANDPIFRRTIGGRLLGLGGILIDLEVLIIRELNKRQDKRFNDIIREQDRRAAEAAARGAESRAERERDLATTTAVEALLNAPETFDPTQQIELPRPDISPVPSGDVVLFPEQFPDLFGELGEPGFGRDPFEFPEVPAPTVDFPPPGQLPSSPPVLVDFPIRFVTPIEIPFRDPLTTFDPVSVPSRGVPDVRSGIDPRSQFQPNPSSQRLRLVRR